MPNMLNSGDIIASIQLDLSDNNAGLISAQDVRHNMEDIAFSINKIVASGDTNVEFPFFNTVTVSKVDALSETSTTATNGDIIVQSGVFFPNAPENSTKRQDRPWLGDGNIDHDNLGNDTHLIYYNRDGSRALEGNMPTASYWINASGTDKTGLKFNTTHATDATKQEILVSGDGFRFSDNSVVPNGKGNAKAWAFFNASGNAVNAHLPEIYSWNNIESISKKAEGQFKITFTSGTFENNHFVAVGTSNGTNASGSLIDMETNTVACVARSGDDGTMLRSVTYVVRDEGGSYTDSAVCQFVAYGYSPTETSGTAPTMVDEFSSPTF